MLFLDQPYIDPEIVPVPRIRLLQEDLKLKKLKLVSASGYTLPGLHLNFSAAKLKYRNLPFKLDTTSSFLFQFNGNDDLGSAGNSECIVFKSLNDVSQLAGLAIDHSIYLNLTDLLINAWIDTEILKNALRQYSLIPKKQRIYL